MAEAQFQQTDGGSVGFRSKLSRLLLLKTQLDNEYSTFRSHHRELSEHIFPRRSRFEVTDQNRGDKRNAKIVNTTPTLAARTLRSGMMGGITSPARPWFKLTTPDPDLANFPRVKEWLELVDSRMSSVFLRSNLYNNLPIVYGDLGTFATAPMFIEEDFGQVIRTQSFPIGSYKIAKDFRGKVNVFYREFQMTVRQVVEHFGRKNPDSGKIDWSNISTRVKGFYENGQYETWVEVHHCVQPNQDWDARSPLSEHKRFSSIYFEYGRGSGSAQQADIDASSFLREKGYDYFPVLCPRWEVTGEDVYGTDCPGMTALGDIKAMMLMEKRKAQAIELQVKPPMQGPSSLRNQKSSILPGDMTFVDSREGQQRFTPTFMNNTNLMDIKQNIKDHEDRIKKAFYEDLFLMMADSDRREITATEIDERKEEKLLALGPVLEQLNQDLLDPLIEITFDLMHRQDLIPPPPPEIQNSQLGAEYVSIMAQAQKMIGLGSLEKFSQFAQTLIAINPQAGMKVNTDELLESYGDGLSVPIKVMHTNDEVAQMKDQMQKAQAAQAQSEQMANAANSAKSLSQADTSGDNGLTQLLDQAKAGQIAPGA